MRNNMVYDIEEHRVEIENRIKNMMWTVSGDYSLKVKPDVEAFAKNKYIALYDAIKQGAFARYFDADALGTYLLKKRYYGAEEVPLMSIAQLCADAASYPAISAERPGVRQVRKKAFEAMLEHEFHRMNQSFAGRVKISYIRDFLNGRRRDEKRVQDVKDALYELEHVSDTMEIIRKIDWIYNHFIDKGFERKHGDLAHVLSVELEEIVQDGWQDFLDEDTYEAVMEQFLENVNRQVTSLEELQEEQEKKAGNGRKIVVLDEKAIARMHSYMELNFGRSYLNEAQQERLNRRLCTGAHTDCSLYYTDGILENPVLVNAQYVNAKKQADRNRLLLHNSASVVRHNIDVMTASLKRALTLRAEKDIIPSEFGRVVPGRLWRIGRTEGGRLFDREIRQNNSEYVVDVLIDASGSQRDRQSQVALQAYIISRALSNVNIPHRVMGFCTFWDYTVMQRYREYDAPAKEDERIFSYTTSANNRDGLAIRAAADSLMQREEENKILIILSDGRPNDVIVNRPNSRNPRIYCGDYAVQDTALEVRRLRNAGIYVLGVFAGKEKDLAAEKKIFGKDFAYIRDIRNFSAVVSRYLQKLLDE
ncbi:cobaltochelatase CobT-related protein [Marvinbryantia sp.]|uniref:cobaltochelatase CobT-related protein n=1 Tax=Marvinbryantia sp. TaxID=2496532 RepID=UPI0028057D6F|nr:nitric oxide reductase activation protein [uncultured Marvinbryantia sp.]